MRNFGKLRLHVTYKFIVTTMHQLSTSIALNTEVLLIFNFADFATEQNREHGNGKVLCSPGIFVGLWAVYQKVDKFQKSFRRAF